MERPYLWPSIQGNRDDVTRASTYLTDACADIHGSAGWSQTTWASACAPSLVLSADVSKLAPRKSMDAVLLAAAATEWAKAGSSDMSAIVSHPSPVSPSVW